MLNYIVFRIYSFYKRKTNTPIAQTISILTFFAFLFFLDIYIIFRKHTNDFLQNKLIIVAIFFLLLVVILNVYNKRRIEIIAEKYKNEPPNNKRLYGYIIVFMMILLFLLPFILSLFFKY